MMKFATIANRAQKRCGGAEALSAKLTPPEDRKALMKSPDDRWLAAMTKCVFQSGFNWQIIEDKWPSFETAFGGFNVVRWSRMSDADVDKLLKCEDIVRNASKIKSVGPNATYLIELIEADGSAGKHYASWSLEDYADNLQDMRKRGSRLGGKTGQIYLRRMGVDTLVFTDDVVKALTAANVLTNDKPPGSKKDWQTLQKTLNDWHEESGYSLNEISQILALSIG
jgi:3-methyladenine DNA glycosylase Tag